MSFRENQERIAACIRTLSDLIGDSPANGGMSHAALRSVMGAHDIEFVRDDDGVLWPFVRASKFWRGPLRKNEESQTIEEARFDPKTEEITWTKPWKEGE